MADIKLNFESLCSIFDGNGVYFLAKDGLGGQLYCSKGLSPSLAKSDGFASSSVVYDSDNGKYFMSRKVVRPDGSFYNLFVDVSEHILSINRLSKTVSEYESQIENLKSTVDMLRLDTVTGLPIRGEALANMRDYASHAKTNRESFATIMFDIDHFKTVNDNYGHDVGDKVLRGVSDVLRNSIRHNSTSRKKDIIGRFGGEEFLILLKDIDFKDISSVSNRIRENVEHKRFFVSSEGDSYPLSVTISGGVAYSDCGDKDLDTMISLSDQAMYQSKNNGRNCITVYEDTKRKVKKPQIRREENK